MTPEPPDAAGVRAALRLGWLMAEARGRARPDSPAAELVVDMGRGHWELPLSSERSAAGRRVEIDHALGAVAGLLRVDPPVQARPRQRRRPARPMPTRRPGRASRRLPPGR